MNWLHDLTNPELYRNFRIFRNIAKLGSLPPLADPSFKALLHQIWATIISAPRISCTVGSSDYDCRHPVQAGLVKTELEKAQWNTYIHINLKIQNTGTEGSHINKFYLDVPGHAKRLLPHLLKNEGRALNYNSDEIHHVAPDSMHLLSLGFVIGTEHEMTKPIKCYLKIKFNNYKKITLKVMTSHRRGNY